MKLKFGLLVLVEERTPENPEKKIGRKARTNHKFNPRAMHI